MSDDFAAVSAIARLDEDRFRAQIPDGWQQGRGAFGGLVLGILARAAEASEPDGTRPLRTLAGDMCGPVMPGAADIHVRVLRRGSNQTNVATELRQNGETLALASVVLSRARPSPSLPPPPLRAVADPFATPVLPLAPPHGPAFAPRYEYRSAIDHATVTGEARTAGWIREREPLGRVDAAALIARLDAWWPTLFHVAGGQRPMATISFMAELLIDPATLPPTEPLEVEAHLAALHEGFCVELRQLRHRGRVVALNQQTFAVIK
jgi:hypothetical protein